MDTQLGGELSLGEAGLLELLAEALNFLWGTTNAIHAPILPRRIVTNRWVWSDDYIPNTYGEDRVYQYREGGFCDPPRWTATVLSIHVRPSPLRPYLATKLEGNRYSLVLRGLMARKYRLQRSSNLITWEDRDEVVGNTSEVDLPGVENDSVHSRFYRVVDITGQ
jgi:hypothetical protein